MASRTRSRRIAPTPLPPGVSASLRASPSSTTPSTCGRACPWRAVSAPSTLLFIPMNSAAERRSGFGVELGRRSRLLTNRVDGHDALGERHRLELIVGDAQRGEPEIADQRLQPGAPLVPQLRIEVGERFVQQDRRAHSDCAGDPQLRWPRRLVRIALTEVREPQAPQRVLDAR